MTKLEHTQKVDTGGGLGATASGQRLRIASALGKDSRSWSQSRAQGALKTRPGGRRHRFPGGCGGKRHSRGQSAGSREHGDDGATGKTRHLDRRAWRQRVPSLRLTQPSQGTRPSGAWREGRARGTRPLGPGKAARPRAFLPVHAEGAAPLVEQAEQQKRGPSQRGVSRRQVLAEGRHGTASTSEPGGGAAAASTTPSAGSAGETGRRRAERREGGADSAGPPPGARRRVVRARLPTTDFSSAGARAGATKAGTALGCSLRTRGPPQGHPDCPRRDAADPFSGARSFAAPVPPVLTPSRVHTHSSSHKNWKSRPTLHRDLVGPATPPTPSPAP